MARQDPKTSAQVELCRVSLARLDRGIDGEGGAGTDYVIRTLRVGKRVLGFSGRLLSTVFCFAFDTMDERHFGDWVGWTDLYSTTVIIIKVWFMDDRHWGQAAALGGGTWLGFG